MLITLLYKTLGLDSRVRIRAERKCEELRREMKSAANVPTKTEAHKKGVSTSDDSPSLKKFGITRDQFTLWQKLAAVPDDKFEQRLAERLMQCLQ
jgi:hypothetical protein